MPHTTANQVRLILAGKLDNLSQADCYLYGEVVQKDIKTALKLYKQAASLGVNEAYFKIGLIYHRWPGKEKKAAKAYYHAFLAGNLLAKTALRELASKNPVAWFYLGSAFVAKQNWLEALQSYRSAIEAGYVPALLHMARLYQADRKAQGSEQVLIKRNADQELHYYKEAAVLGSAEGLAELERLAQDTPQAAFYLAQVHERLPHLSKAKAVEHYAYASRSGNAQASFRLGRIWEEGSLSMTVDKLKAADYYLLAYKQDQIEALASVERLAKALHDKELYYKLAELYFLQIKNKERALEYYKLAADKGHIGAQDRLYQHVLADPAFGYKLGLLYESGAVGVRDELKAYSAYAVIIERHAEAKARLQTLVIEGNADAQYALGYLHYRQANNLSEAAKYCMYAAEKNHSLALNYLNQTQFPADIYFEIANRYKQGSVVPVNLSRALGFYEKAVKAGKTDALFSIGKIFETGGAGLTANIRSAFNYYLQAAKARHVEAVRCAVRLAETMNNKDSFYQLAELYDKTFDDKPQAIGWYKSAAALNSSEAWQALANLGNSQNRSNVRAAIVLAELCTKHAVNHQHVVGWYARASALGNKEASFRLGQIHETGEFGATADYSKAGDYYAQAVKQKHPEALSAFGRLVDNVLKTKEFNNGSAELNKAKELYFTFAELCFTYVENKMLALKWYKLAADRDHKSAASKLNSICSRDPDFSYALGQLYESGEEGSRNRLKAFLIYATAMQNRHQEARKILEAGVRANNADAQYALGYGYYHQEARLKEALRLCMLAAEQGHTQAWAYLSETPFGVEAYMEIGTRYESGLEVRVNLDRAISFFEKAYAAGKKDIALKLARLYESRQGNFESDANKACEYYIQAVKQGCLDALAPLECLAAAASKDVQLAVAGLYRSPFINNPMAAQAWEQKAGRSSAHGTTTVVSTLSTFRFAKPGTADPRTEALKALIARLSQA